MLVSCSRCGLRAFVTIAVGVFTCVLCSSGQHKGEVYDVHEPPSTYDPPSWVYTTTAGVGATVSVNTYSPGSYFIAGKT